MRKTLLALSLGLVLSIAGAWNAGAMAGPPDKEPDATLDDHPSGKDRNEEPGRSGTQGKSSSDPDKEANRGPDKPDGDGGFDADKDGNNGCGNDDDFEDDNNGNCGGRRVNGDVDSTVLTTETTTRAATTVESSTVESDAKVLGVSFVREQAAVAGGDTAVLGTSFVRSAGLAATGTPVWVLVALGLAFMLMGGLLVRIA